MEKYIIKKQKIIIIILSIVIGLLSICLIVTGVLLYRSNSEKVSENTAVVKNELDGLPKYTMGRTRGYIEYEGEIDAKFSYPENWTSVGTPDMPMFVDMENNQASVNLSVADFAEDTMDFTAFIELSKLNIKEKCINGEVKQEMINLNGRKACKLEFASYAEGNSSVVMKVTQAIFIADNKVYVLTLVAPESKYDNVKPELDNILKTFRK